MFTNNRSFSKPIWHLLAESHHRNTRTKCDLPSKLIKKASEQSHLTLRYKAALFIDNFEHISHLGLVFLLCIFEQLFANREYIFIVSN